MHVLVKNNYLEKEKVVFCRETDSLRDVLGLLYESGYRCIPVLDAEDKFVGNVYKVHILEYESAKFLDVTVSKVLKDKEGHISADSSFFNIFFTIKRLPFLAVVDANQKFLGILPHSMVFDILEDSWGYKNGGYTLTIGTHDYNGALIKILKVIKKYSEVLSVLSMDNESKTVRRIVVTLPKNVTADNLSKIIKELDNKGFLTVHIDEY